MTSKLTEAEICQQVRSCLMKIKQDNAFMDGSNLHASDYNDIKSEKADKKKLNMFLDFVSESLKKTKKAKRARGKLDSMLDIILKEIAAFDPATYKEGEDNGSAAAGNSTAAVDGQNEGTKKRRRSSSNTAEPKKKKGKNRKSFTFGETEKRQLAKQMKIEYSQKREELEDELDEDYKKHFGRIAFSRWKKDPLRPVVLLGPYSVPPPLRETWMKMYENTKGDPKRMWYYCFWYGSPMNEAYTHAKLREVTLYEVAEKRGTHTLDKKIVAKLEKGKKLSKMEQQVHEGFKVLDEELKKEPADRVPEHFKEDHDILLDMEDQISLEGGDSMDDDGVDDDVVPEAEDSDDDDDEVPETVVKKPVAKKKKPAKKAPKKKEKPKPVVDTEEAPPEKKPEKKPKVVKKAVEDPVSDIGEAEYSDEDEKDESFEKSDDDDDDDDDDQDFEAVVASPKKKSKKKAGGKSNGDSKKSAKKVKKENIQEPMDKKKAEQLAKRRDRDRLNKRRKDEAKAYDECVETFGKAIKALTKAVGSKDASRIVKMLTYIKKQGLDNLSAPYIEDCKLAALLKAIKPILEDDSDKKVRKDFWEGVKKVYTSKKDLVPEGDWRKHRTTRPPTPLEQTKSAPKKSLAVKEEAAEPSAKQEPAVDEKQEPKEDRAEVVEDVEMKDVKKESTLDSSRHSLNGNDLTQDDAPMRKKSGMKRAMSLDGATLQKTATKRAESTGSQPKPKKKKFSLSNVLNKDKPKAKIEDAPQARKSFTPDEIVAKKMPQWLTEDVQDDPSTPLSESRQLALEFFDELGEHYFPKTISRPGFARALEKATDAWAHAYLQTPDGMVKVANGGEDARESTYWERVHTIVGAISGMHKPGVLLNDILNGKYKSAEEVVNLKDEVLLESFEGGPNNGFY